jgi:hypothetical protein
MRMRGMKMSAEIPNVASTDIFSMMAPEIVWLRGVLDERILQIIGKLTPEVHRKPTSCPKY